MDRYKLEELIKQDYNSQPDYPWKEYPSYEVFRHGSNKKWFALIMDIPRARLGLEGSDIIDVVNLKCDSNLIGSLLMEEGFYPAYHMNKNNWITVTLDGSASDEMLKMLLDISYELTAPKVKAHRKNSEY